MPVNAPAPFFVTVTDVPLPALPAPAGYATDVTSPRWYVGTATTLPSTVNCVTFESTSYDWPVECCTPSAVTASDEVTRPAWS